MGDGKAGDSWKELDYLREKHRESQKLVEELQAEWDKVEDGIPIKASESGFIDSVIEGLKKKFNGKDEREIIFTLLFESLSYIAVQQLRITLLEGRMGRLNYHSKKAEEFDGIKPGKTDGQ